MNDKIKQLAQQALNELTSNGPRDLEVVLSPFDIRLAQLIVQECIQELEISKKCDPYTGDLSECEYNTCIEEQVLVLKEHFGVSE